MDKDVLLGILNRLENKLDTVSNGLTTNTVVTESHTKMLSDMRGVHDVNAKVILETRDEIKDLKNEVLKITSWKNGQIIQNEKVIMDVRTLHDRILPLEQDFIERKDKKKEIQKKGEGFLWRAIEKIIFAIAGATLISWKTIIDNFK